jgi:hypothetical protein
MIKCAWPTRQEGWWSGTINGPALVHTWRFWAFFRAAEIEVAAS